MAQDDRFDLARLERLEWRLQALEDAEAIRNLKAGSAPAGAACSSPQRAACAGIVAPPDASFPPDCFV
jgi:hypothetical protein